MRISRAIAKVFAPALCALLALVPTRQSAQTQSLTLRGGMSDRRFIRASDAMIGCGSSWQHWYYNDFSSPIVDIDGPLVRSTHLSTAGDGDWGFFINPTSAWPKVNAHHHSNGDNWVEAEAMIHGSDAVEQWLPTAFPTGAHVLARGYWVYDTAHDDKTELHPLRMIMGDPYYENPFWVFVPQDGSARFIVGAYPVWESIDLTLPVSSAVWSNGGTRPPSETQVLREHSIAVNGSATASAGVGGISLFVQLPASWFSPDCSISYGYHWKVPAYLGRFTRTSEALIDDHVQYSVSPMVGTGYKVMSIDVTATLSNPLGTGYANDGIAYSGWRHNFQAGFGPSDGFVTQTLTAAPHSIHFNDLYSPAEGYNGTTWVLEVYGSNRKSSWSPGPDYFSDRVFVADRRTYRITPSRISFAITSKKGGTATNCTDHISATIDEANLLPQIALKSFAWQVTQLADENGIPISNSTAQAVTPTSPFVGSGVNASTSWTDPKMLQMSFGLMGGNQLSLARLQVAANAETELGEQISVKRVFRNGCGLGSFSFAEIQALLHRVLWSRHYGGEPEPWVARARPEDREWIQALAVWNEGRRLTPRQEGLLLRKAREARLLPPVSDNMADSFSSPQAQVTVTRKVPVRNLPPKPQR